MTLRKTIVAVLSTTLILLMASAVIAPAAHWSGLPKVDTVYFKAYPGAMEEVIVGEFLDCVTDWIEGPYRCDLYADVIAAGHNVSAMDPMAACKIFAINCRDYKETSGNPNAPLNDSCFRVALSYIYGMDDKQADIHDYHCGLPWIWALGNPVPSAQLPWHDPAIQMPNTDNETAWAILSACGYTVQDYNGQQWLHRNGVSVRPPDGPNGGEIVFLYPTGHEEYPQGVGGGFVRNFNAFITGYLGASGPLMTIVPADYISVLVELYCLRDYDIAAHELVDLGRYVKWLWSTLHSDNDVVNGTNFSGIHDTIFDSNTSIIRTSMSVPAIIGAASSVQARFVYQIMPWFPAIEYLEYCTTKVIDSNDFLTNLVNMDIYGPRNSYSWMCLHWYGTPAAYPGDPGAVWPGSSYAAALRGEPWTLNPWTEYSKYGWEIMERSILTGETGLMGVSPSTLKNTPFVATDYHLANWTSIPELGIDSGSMATFWLRQDVLWHDHECQYNDHVDTAYFDPNTVDAYDCVANLEFLTVNKPPRWSHVWEHLIYSEADGPFKFSAYFDETSICHASHVSDAALLVPEHVIEAVGDNWTIWTPCDAPSHDDCTYDDLMGECNDTYPCPPSYPWLKQLVGCGPFVFHYYDRALAVGQVDKFNEFFVSAPVIGSVVGEWRIDPNDDYEYAVLIHNIGAKTSDDWGHLTNATVDVAIYEDDVLAHIVNDTTLDPWEYKYLPGSKYVYANVQCPPCVHTIRVVVTGPNFRHVYVHRFVTTIREDITTYCGDLLDCKVDMRDVGRAARAFGSYPGHIRWEPCCDVNGDFKVDMRDIGAVARVFGWQC